MRYYQIDFVVLNSCLPEFKTSRIVEAEIEDEAVTATAKEYQGRIIVNDVKECHREDFDAFVRNQELAKQLLSKQLHWRDIVAVVQSDCAR